MRKYIVRDTQFAVKTVFYLYTIAMLSSITSRNLPEQKSIIC